MEVRQSHQTCHVGVRKLGLTRTTDLRLDSVRTGAIRPRVAPTNDDVLPVRTPPDCREFVDLLSVFYGTGWTRSQFSFIDRRGRQRWYASVDCTVTAVPTLIFSSATFSSRQQPSPRERSSFHRCWPNVGRIERVGPDREDTDCIVALWVGPASLWDLVATNCARR
jgi:hypothetical protein